MTNTVKWPEGSEHSEFGIYCNGIPEAFTEGPRDQALEEAMRYAAQYSQDGEVEVLEIMRRKIEIGTAHNKCLDLGLYRRRRAAFEAFQHGESIEAACRMHAIETRDLEIMIRRQYEANEEELAADIAAKLGRTSSADIRAIAVWLRRTMIWILRPEADLVAEALANVEFAGP